MPTVLRWKGWTFLFYSADSHEPPHVHVRMGRREAKFWLSDCTVAANRRVAEHDLNALQKKVAQHRERFLEMWHAHFGP